MSARRDLAPALLRWYAAALSVSGYGAAAAPVLALAQRVESLSPSAAQLSALHAAGLLTGAGTLTPEGLAVLAQVQGEPTLSARGEP